MAQKLHPVRQKRARLSSGWNRTLFERLPELAKTIDDMMKMTGGEGVEEGTTLDVPCLANGNDCRDLVSTILENFVLVSSLAHPDNVSVVFVATEYTTFGCVHHGNAGCVDVLIQRRELKAPLDPPESPVI